MPRVRFNALPRARCLRRTKNLVRQVGAEPSELESWLETKDFKADGVRIGTDNEGLRGVFATASKKGGSVLVSVSPDCIITPKVARESEVGQRMLAHVDNKSLSDVGAIMPLFLVSEKRKGSASKYAAYIASLPTIQEFDDHPLMYLQHDCNKLLDGTGFGFKMRRVLRSLKRVQKTFESIFRFRFHELLWAYLIINTRSFYGPVAGVNSALLVPYADMFNHKIGAQSRWHYRDDGYFDVIVRNNSSVQEQQEVRVNYGEPMRSRLEMFSCYGIYSDQPEFDSAFVTLADDEYEVSSEYASPATLRFFSTVRAIKWADDQNIEDTKPRQTLRVTVDTAALSVDNEIRTMITIADAAMEQLRFIQGDQETDMKVLAGNKLTKGSEQRNCFLIRSKERDVLQWLIELGDFVLPLLRQIYVEGQVRKGHLEPGDIPPQHKDYYDMVVKPLEEANQMDLPG